MPDLIFFNGKIITVDKHFTMAEAIAIKDDRIQTVGTKAEILKLSGQTTEQVDLRGQTVLPGLIDALVHPTMTALSELPEDYCRKLKRKIL